MTDFPVPVPGALDWRDVPTYSENDLQKAAAAARAAEREAIIRLAEQRSATYPGELVSCTCGKDCGVIRREALPFADLLTGEGP